VCVCVCVCVCVSVSVSDMRKSIQGRCILIPIRNLTNVRYSTNPSTFQSRASPRVIHAWAQQFC